MNQTNKKKHFSSIRPAIIIVMVKPVNLKKQYLIKITLSWIIKLRSQKFESSQFKSDIGFWWEKKSKADNKQTQPM